MVNSDIVITYGKGKVSARIVVISCVKSTE